MTITLNSSSIEKVQAQGNHWTKGSFDRYYLNVQDIIDVEFYKSGRVSYSATLDGEKISHSRASQMLCTKIYLEGTELVCDDDELLDLAVKALSLEEATDEEATDEEATTDEEVTINDDLDVFVGDQKVGYIKVPSANNYNFTLMLMHGTLPICYPCSTYPIKQARDLEETMQLITGKKGLFGEFLKENIGHLVPTWPEFSEVK